MQTSGYVGYIRINGRRAKKCAGRAMTVHVSGHGPGCALSENAKMSNMQVESLEIVNDFVLFIIEYSQAIVEKRHPTIWSHSLNFLSSDSRLIDSSANYLKRCNENHMF